MDTIAYKWKKLGFNSDWTWRNILIMKIMIINIPIDTF